MYKSSVFLLANSCASERSQKSKSEVEANAGKARLPIWPTLCAAIAFFAPTRIYPAFEWPHFVLVGMAFRKFGYFLQNYVQRGYAGERSRSPSLTMMLPADVRVLVESWCLCHVPAIGN